MDSGIGSEFQARTRYHRDRMPGGTLDWSAKPETYKDYPGSEVIELPQAEPAVDVSLHGALVTRRSVRRFAQEPIGLDQLSYLLWASTGIRREEHGREFRTAPSAGALYPIETYLVANNVAGLPRGLYHYSIRRHALELLRQADLRVQAARAALDQETCAEAAAVFIWTAVFGRSVWKYRQRAYRYVYLDAGHIAENLALASAGMGLGSCQIAALYDDEANALVGVDDVEESVIYMSVVGVPG